MALNLAEQEIIPNQIQPLQIAVFADGPLTDYTLRFLPVDDVWTHCGAVQFPDTQVVSQGELFNSVNFTSPMMG